MVREVALHPLVAAEPEVGDEIARRDDRLRLEGDRRRDDPHGGAVGLEQVVHLGLVLAVRPHPLPQERDGIQPQDVDADRREVEHGCGHGDEHLGVGVVEIPLVGVERRPHPPPELRVEREVAGGGVGEDLGQRALVGVGLRPVRERAVEGQPPRVALPRRDRPGMLPGRVVEDHVDAERHARRAQLRRQLAQVGDRPQRRLDGAVVGDGVAAVVRLGPRPQQRHQVQVGDAELAQVAETLADAPQRPGEAVDVRDVAHGLLAVEPVRGDLALVIERAQLRVAGGGGGRDQIQQGVPGGREPRIVPVDGVQRVVQLGEEALEAPQEGVVAPDARQRVRVTRADLRTHRVDVLHGAAECGRRLRRGAGSARRAPAARRAARSPARATPARAAPGPERGGASSTVGCSGSACASRTHSNARWA